MKIDIQKIMNRLPNVLRCHKIAKALLAFSPDSKMQLVEFNENGKLYGDLSDPFTRSYFLTRSFEPEFFKIAVPFLKKGGIFFDVGSNFGFCSFGMMAKLPGRVESYHLFEANPNIYGQLIRSRQLWKEETICLKHACISEAPGTARFAILKDHLGASHVSEKGDVEVPKAQLDPYIAAQRIEKISFMKMDIEGFEFEALKGARESLQKGIVRALYVEIANENLERYHHSPEDILDYLKECGFDLFYIKEIDLKRLEGEGKALETLTIHGDDLKAYPLNQFLTGQQTDVLAIHKGAELLNK